ncbi:MAG: hypothetical protein DHS20C08_23480 [Rhodomicrobium sp.]|nr:MAG: hypothetical protein DHS20C08_23480 [Rhodomicrobium sp.]
MSSTDERILQSVDDVISAIGRLLEDIQAAPDISLIQKNLAVQKASEVTVFIDEINGILVPDAEMYFDAGHYDDGQTEGEALSPEEQLQPRLIIQPAAQMPAEPAVETEALPEFGSGVDPHHDEQEEDAASISDGGLEDQQVRDVMIDDDALEVADVSKAERNNLTLINGIDAETEAHLNRHDIVRFEQVAKFSAEQILEISHDLGDPSRVARENWIEQAALLVNDVQTYYAAQMMEADVFDRRVLNAAYLTAGAPVKTPLSADDISLKDDASVDEEASALEGMDVVETEAVDTDAETAADVFAKVSAGAGDDAGKVKPPVSLSFKITELPETEEADEKEPVNDDTQHELKDERSLYDETVRLTNERALLEAELAKLRAELAEQQDVAGSEVAGPEVAGPEVAGSEDAVLAEPVATSVRDEPGRLDVSLTPQDEQLEEAVEPFAEADQSDASPRSNIDDELYADAAALANEDISEKDLVRGAIWHEEVSTGANYVPPLDEHESEESFTPVDGSLHNRAEDITPEISHPQHHELSGLAAIFDGSIDPVEHGKGSVDQAADEAGDARLYADGDISLPKQPPVDSDFARPGEIAGRPVESESDEAAETPAPSVLPFPVARDGEDGGGAKDGLRAMGPRPLSQKPFAAPKPFSDLSRAGRAPFKGPPVGPPKGTPGPHEQQHPQMQHGPRESRPLKAQPPGDVHSMARATENSEKTDVDGPLKGQVPPVSAPPFMRPVLNGGAVPPSVAGAMPPPMPPVGGTKIGASPDGVPPRSMDELYIPGGAPRLAASDEGERDKRPSDLEAAPQSEGFVRGVGAGQDAVDQGDGADEALSERDEIYADAALEEDDSSSLGQYLARKRANNSAPQFRDAPPAHEMPNRGLSDSDALNRGAPDMGRMQPAMRRDGGQNLPPHMPPPPMQPPQKQPNGNGVPGSPLPEGGLPPRHSPNLAPPQVGGRPPLSAGLNPGGPPSHRAVSPQQPPYQNPAHSQTGPMPTAFQRQSSEQGSLPGEPGEQDQRQQPKNGEQKRVSEGFRSRARQFAEKLERSFVDDEDK